jgi:hypothetical protein
MECVNRVLMGLCFFLVPVDGKEEKMGIAIGTPDQYRVGEWMHWPNFEFCYGIERRSGTML